MVDKIYMTPAELSRVKYGPSIEVATMLLKKQGEVNELRARVAELERQIADREAIDVVHHAETMKALADVKRKIADQLGE